MVEDSPEQRYWLETVERDRLILVFIVRGETFLIMCPCIYVRIRLVVPSTVEA
jgi:hypothetical protein